VPVEADYAIEVEPPFGLKKGHSKHIHTYKQRESSPTAYVQIQLRLDPSQNVTVE
jgi:hypothetical protein